MTRSILWISSRAPCSALPMACGALPQPRSRMALAADTRAAAVASFARMTPTSTLSAVRVWLRASERISVTALTTTEFLRLHFRQDGFAKRRVDVIHDHIVGSFGGPERGKIRPVAIAPAGAGEWNDLCAHDVPSHMMIASRPAKASEI